MISRRSFLKMSGLAATAACAGFGAGRLWAPGPDRSFAIRGFLPGDEAAIGRLVDVFADRIGIHAEPIVLAEGQWAERIARAYGASVARQGASSVAGDGALIFRMDRIPSPLPADIMVSGENRLICRPERDYDRRLTALREEIRGKTAAYAFAAEYRDGQAPGAALRNRGDAAVVRCGEAFSRRVSLQGPPRSLTVNGDRGKTTLRIEEGTIRVVQASCRHELCRKAGSVSRCGQVIACVPNGLLVTVTPV